MRRKILIVDDEPVVLDILGKKLQMRNYEVFTASDGEQGMECARNVSPDLIMLDVLMPRKDGLEMLQELKADSKLSDIPVIIVSARKAAKEKLKGESEGAIAYLFKPVEFCDLLQQVEYYIKK